VSLLWNIPLHNLHSNVVPLDTLLAIVLADVQSPLEVFLYMLYFRTKPEVGFGGYALFGALSNFFSFVIHFNIFFVIHSFFILFIYFDHTLIMWGDFIMIIPYIQTYKHIHIYTYSVPWTNSSPFSSHSSSPSSHLFQTMFSEFHYTDFTCKYSVYDLLIHIWEARLLAFSFLPPSLPSFFLY
jgi:hypothetical protein